MAEYKQVASLRKPIASHWDVIDKTSDTPVKLINEGSFFGAVMGIFLIAVALTVCVLTLMAVGAGLQLISEEASKAIFWIAIAGIWLPAVGLIYERVHNTSQVKVYLLPADPARIEVIRFVQTSYDNLVPPEDLVFFLERSALTGRSGKQAWRNTRMPSGAKCNDAYHDQIIQALSEAGVWQKGKGERSAGKRTVPLEIAKARLTP